MLYATSNDKVQGIGDLWNNVTIDLVLAIMIAYHIMLITRILCYPVVASLAVTVQEAVISRHGIHTHCISDRCSPKSISTLDFFVLNL